MKISVSTPSRICLFGEHQDYLNLEVIASAINLRFSAEGTKRDDRIIHVRLKGEGISREEIIDLDEEIVYENNRDYIKSAVNVLRRKGYSIETGFDIYMDSDIPIGKGMCSSTTMVVVFIKILLELINHEDKDDPEKIALLGFEAEVTEFNEPGGLMDQYSSAYGGLLHLTFDKDKTVVEPLETEIPGCFILFDSLEDKQTTKVLGSAKYPVLEALDELKEYGISSIRDFVNDEENLVYLDKLSPVKLVKVKANIDNYKTLKQAEKMFKTGVDSVKLGELLKRHHGNLRDGLEISTPKIEEILETAYENGALGGKINGSGGGGCCYVYAYEKDAQEILDKVCAKGYWGVILKQDSGVRVDK
ncbi:galactokinase [Vallitalea sediminicola]